jgi:hypothetical protein
LKTRHSTILKKGTEADKAKVALATNGNRARRPSTRPGRHGTDSVSVWTGSSGTTINPNKKTICKKQHKTIMGMPLAMLLKTLNYLKHPVHEVKKLSEKLMSNSESKLRNRE